MKRWFAGWRRTDKPGLEIRRRWGWPGSDTATFAARYFELSRGAGAETVSDKVWSDLELQRIFHRINTAITPVGAQVLYRQMREYVVEPSELDARRHLYAWMREHPLQREHIQRWLWSLRDEHYATLARFIHADGEDSPRWAEWLPLSALAGLMLPVGVIGLGWPLWPWLVVIMLNLVATWRLWWSGAHHGENVKSCLDLLTVAERLTRLDTSGDVEPLRRLREAAPARRRTRKLLREFLLTRLPGISYLMPLANALLALEPLLYLRVNRRMAVIRPCLAQVYQLVGQLDAGIAIASFLASQPWHCAPRMTALDLRIVEGVHPLIEGCVPHSIELRQRSALVTGSNMAGKTSFIKSLAIQVILGQTLGICLARQAEIPAVRVLTSIHVDHSVEAGISHFFSELETIRQFMELASSGTTALLVMDEIFSGTNTLERIASARAVLERLATGCMVLVTTHDVELQSCLGTHYDLYHFQENIDVDGFFDYQLRRGAASQRNAIRLLGKLGYPADLVETAMAYAAAADAGSPRPTASGF